GNAQHERRAESIVKRTVDLAAIVEYDVTPIVAKRSDKAGLLAKIDNSREGAEYKKVKKAIVEAEDFVPSELDIEAHMLDEVKQNEFKRRESFLTIKVPNPIPRDFNKYYLRTEPKPAPVNLSTETSVD